MGIYRAGAIILLSLDKPLAVLLDKPCSANEVPRACFRQRIAKTLSRKDTVVKKRFCCSVPPTRSTSRA